MIPKCDFTTQEDYIFSLNSLINPLRESILNSKYPGLKLGTSGAVYNQQRADMESLIRPLWGLAPLWTLEPDNSLIDAYVSKIEQGVNPNHSNYWGDITDYDQYIVEMAALALTLLLNKKIFWGNFTKEGQINLVIWFKQALERKTPKNNWIFFKVLIRTALFKCGEDLDKQKLYEELSIIDSMYIGNGWYVDGKNSQKDYYIPFAFHFYGLIFATFMKDEEPEWSQLFKKRASLFTQTFIYYFDDQGEALPFGRSLTYRFAQGALFSALIFADVEAIPWGQMKTILSKHMTNWFKHPIFTFDNRLSIGYHYENLVMAEGYNAPGSPYWALKTFLILAVDSNHPFWKAKLEPIKLEKQKMITDGNIILIHEQKDNHLLGFPAGLFIKNQAHSEAKYSKFVYSSRFGFSVPKSNNTYQEGAFDNTLALSLDGKSFRTKGEVQDYKVNENSLFYLWQPFNNVLVSTEIYPFGESHIRFHTIETAGTIEIREGGFSVPLYTRDLIGDKNESQAFVSGDGLISFIKNIEGYDEADITQLEPNTSLFFPRTSLPFLKKTLTPGKYRLISLVSGIAK